ncbi:hypothetical protein CPB83DRAFT_898192 [Crepidotus variabilis]|uniref:Uncharacterized protein n=1 Tax=Crepidotus variabilis TaxID=179855 RepID=A0A9P6E7Q1_9AGAR|nr:hypothetical protein CPB83DRAFT_898192 [Crepidotus variabilis]
MERLNTHSNLMKPVRHNIRRGFIGGIVSMINGKFTGSDFPEFSSLQSNRPAFFWCKEKDLELLRAFLIFERYFMGDNALGVIRINRNKYSQATFVKHRLGKHYPKISLSTSQVRTRMTALCENYIKFALPAQLNEHNSSSPDLAAYSIDNDKWMCGKEDPIMDTKPRASSVAFVDILYAIVDSDASTCSWQVVELHQKSFNAQFMVLSLPSNTAWGCAIVSLLESIIFRSSHLLALATIIAIFKEDEITPFFWASYSLSAQRNLDGFTEYSLHSLNKSRGNMDGTVQYLPPLLHCSDTQTVADFRTCKIRQQFLSCKKDESDVSQEIATDSVVFYKFSTSLHRPIQID